MIQLIALLLAIELVFVAAGVWLALWLSWQCVQILLFLGALVRFAWLDHGKPVADPRPVTRRSSAWLWFRRVWLD